MSSARRRGRKGKRLSNAADKHEGRERGPRRRRRGGSSRTRLVVAGVVVAAVATWWFARPRGEPPTPAVPGTALPIAALIDSLRSAKEGERWARSVYWAGRLTTAQPNNPMYMLELGLALHNWAWAGRPHQLARAATRSSLERVRLEKRVLALLDSAKAFARNHDEAARVRHWGAHVLEIYGLPVDAARAYDEALQFDPSFELTLPRARWVMNSLRDPVAGGFDPPGAGVVSQE